MRQSVVKALLDREVKEPIRKERAQSIISALEVRFGEVSEAIKSHLVSIDDEDILSYLHRQSVVTDKDEIEREILALSA